MPLYEYECESCHQRFEKIQKFSDPLVEVCPKCGKGPVTKLLSSPAIQFKGTGWYITDYAKKSSADAGTTKGPGSSENSGEKKSDTGSKSSSDSSSSTPAATSTTKKD
jgi:putative FmdB family regulatory protein